MARHLAIVFLPAVITSAFSWAEKYSQLHVNFSGGLLPFSQILPSCELFTRKVHFSVHNQDCHLSLRFRPAESAPSGINWPFAVIKYYCFTLTNKSQQHFIASQCEIRPPNQLDATAWRRNGDDCQCSWFNSIRNIFFSPLVKGVVKMNASQTSEICNCIKELLKQSNISMIFELSRHSAIIDVAALSRLIKIGVTDLLLKISNPAHIPYSTSEQGIYLLF